MRQIAALFGTSKSAADRRIIDDLAPKLALRPRQRYAPETGLIVDGTLVPTRDHAIAAPSKNYRYSTNHQVVIHADTRLVVAVGSLLPGNRNDCKAFAESGADHATRTATVIADGGYIGSRARIEPAFAKMKAWKIMRDCCRRGTGVGDAVAGIARLHNLAITD